MSYIGVTGFMTKAEVEAALEPLDGAPDWGDRRLMIGVLVSAKTLDGKKNKLPNRYPDVKDIASLFPPDRRTVNLIHYATDDLASLTMQLERLVLLGGKYLDGFQLNVCWPDPSSLAPFTDQRIVLQLGQRALGKTNFNPEATANYLDAYKSVITDVLVDASGGRGVPIDMDIARQYVRAIHERHPHLGIGVAGGLSAATVGQLRPLTMLYPWISLDAEGRLRDQDDRLDIATMEHYLIVANNLFE